MRSALLGLILIICGILCVLAALGFQYVLFHAQNTLPRESISAMHLTIIVMTMMAGFVMGGIGTIIVVWGGRE
jgi:hypothetical protein